MDETTAAGLLEQADAEAKKRAADMPTEQDAIDAMFRAHLRLRELGWRDVMYAPTDAPLDVIEAGSTGIHHATRDEECRFWIHDGETWPSKPCLFRLQAAPYPRSRAMTTDDAAYSLTDNTAQPGAALRTVSDELDWLIHSVEAIAFPQGDVERSAMSDRLWRMRMALDAHIRTLGEPHKVRFPGDEGMILGKP